MSNNQHPLGERVAKLESIVENICDSVDSLALSLDEKHKENRKSIHDVRNGQETLFLKLALMKGWVGGAAAVGGIVGGIALHFLDKAFK